MKNYLFDTNIIMSFLRKDIRWFEIEKKYDLKSSNNFISVISLGELKSLAIRNKWGEFRLSRIELLRNDFSILDINMPKIIDHYGEIDCYSQGKLDGKPLSHSARNMGKNDLWIAATASVFTLTLLTSDQDFTHLAKTYLDLELIDFQAIV
jgi:tRNA(fMet)-specific endonuclease VapC